MMPTYTRPPYPPVPPRTGTSDGMLILFILITLAVGLIFGFGIAWYLNTLHQAAHPCLISA